MDEFPLTFSLPKNWLTEANEFSLFFLGTGGHFITFSISTLDMLCFIFWSQDYLNWLTTDISQLFSVMQILTARDGKGQYFQSIHTCLLHVWRESRVQTGSGVIACHMTIWEMTFYQGHLQLWAWVSADSVQVNCPPCPYVLQGVCTTIQIAIFPIFFPIPPVHVCLSLFLSLWLSYAYTCSQTLCTWRKKYSANKRDYS